MKNIRGIEVIMNRFALFFLFGLCGWCVTSSAMNYPTVHPYFEEVEPAGIKPQSQNQRPSLVGNVDHPIANEANNYGSLSQRIKRVLSNFVPSKKTIGLGLGRAFLQTAVSKICNNRTIFGLNAEHFTFSDCLSYIAQGWTGGQFILDTHNKSRCYNYTQPTRYSLLSKQLQFQEFAEQCLQMIQQLNSNKTINVSKARMKIALRNRIMRFNRFSNHCAELINNFQNRTDAHAQEMHDLLNDMFNDGALLALGQFIDESKQFIIQLEGKKNSGTAQERNELNDKLIELDMFLEACEQFFEERRDAIHEFEANQQANSENHKPAIYHAPRVPQLVSNWSYVHAGMAVATAVGASLLFPKIVALVGTINALKKAGSFLSHASAKPGIAGLAALFGLNCAAAFGSHATTYALEKLVINPVLKPLVIRLLCKLQGVPYNPQPAQAQ